MLRPNSPKSELRNEVFRSLPRVLVFLIAVVFTLTGCLEREDEPPAKKPAKQVVENTVQKDIAFIEAKLLETKPIAYEAKCIGSKPGKAALGCDIERDLEFARLMKDLRSGISAVDNFRRNVRALADRVHLRLEIASQGRADGMKWRPDADIEDLYNTYLRLGPTFGTFYPLEKRSENFDAIVAVTRSMNLLDIVRTRVETCLIDLRAVDRVKVDWTIRPPHLSSEIGDEHRGATFAATMNLSLSDKTLRQELVAALELNHWEVKVKDLEVQP